MGYLCIGTLLSREPQKERSSATLDAHVLVDAHLRSCLLAREYEHDPSLCSNSSMVCRSHGGRDPCFCRAFPGALSAHHLFLVRGCNLLIVEIQVTIPLVCGSQGTKLEDPMESVLEGYLPGASKPMHGVHIAHPPL